MRIENLADDVNSAIFYRSRASKFNVKAIGIGQTGLISFPGGSDAEHAKFVKAVRQACYRAKPMKFQVAVYDAYEKGCVAVRRVA